MVLEAVRLVAQERHQQEERLSLKKRYEDRAVLIDALLGQKIIRGNETIAAAFADAGDLVEFAAGKNIIEQGDSDRSVHFLLSGRGLIIINGVRLYHREPPCTIGEMSAINPSIGRSASIEAVEDVVTLKVGYEKFAEVGEAHPECS